MPSATSGYTLVICEKPDAARRVAEVLSSGTARRSSTDGIETFRFISKGEDFVVCSAQGHVYSIADRFKERIVYPVFDVEWYPVNFIGKGNAYAANRINVIHSLATGASRFINACDFDPEGETIGFNILRYACRDKENEAFRAKFSTLTKDEVVSAFGQAKCQTGQGQARAGRARHTIDFLWGINLSRALSQAMQKTRVEREVISMGRVQGPALAFLANREAEIREFVPKPYWKISGVFKGKGASFIASYSKERIRIRTEAEEVRMDCEGEQGVVTNVLRYESSVQPPPPFNTGDLQKEAYRTLRFSPSRTLQIAEKLYLAALISYPRTNSQNLPPSINYPTVLRGLGRLNQYSQAVEVILGGAPKPSRGPKTDLAHPAIYPTGEAPRGRLGRPESAIFDLITRRFLATFGPPDKRERVEVRLTVGGHKFMFRKERIVRQGWTGVYGKCVNPDTDNMPEIVKGDKFRVTTVDVTEAFESGPTRFNQSTLLEKMERENIGTKATRAEIISTLIDRGYVESGNDMKVTDLGLTVVEAVEKYTPAILTTRLTRDVEEKIERVEAGSEGDADLIRETVRVLVKGLAALNANEDQIGLNISAARTIAHAKASVLGSCPICKVGELRAIRSMKTRKRFVGCSNYRLGCRASAPLPQRGKIETTTKPCDDCSWPVVLVIGGGRPWKLCINPSCPNKKQRNRP